MTDAPIVPSFDDDAAAAPAGRKICFICSKGNLDMAYPALIMGSAALGEGIETHFFFTFWGMDIITRRTMGDLKFSMVGNTAMHMPGQFGFSMPQGMAGLPGVTALTTKMMKKQIADLEVPDVPEFLDQLVEMGGHMWACRMSFDMANLTEADLYEGVEAVISATDFIELSEGAQVIFI